MKLGVVMDPIQTIKVEKDTTLALLLAAQRRQWSIHYMEMADLYLDGATPRGRARRLTVYDRAQRWHQFGRAETLALTELDALLVRKDPPFDMEYIYMTYILEHLAAAGTQVVNHPTGLRELNEKASITRFPQCIAPTLITRSAERIQAFLEEHGPLILKPLDGMGGASVFRLDPGDPNRNVIVETLTGNSQRFTMAQQYLAAVVQGDKRILLIDGEPYPYALARIPPPGELRGNLAVGGTGEGVALSARDRWLCEQVGPTLQAMGMRFVGLDVIGDYLTEINVTSPTCLRELERLYDQDIAGQVMDCIAGKVTES